MQKTPLHPSCWRNHECYYPKMGPLLYGALSQIFRPARHRRGPSSFGLGKPNHSSVLTVTTGTVDGREWGCAALTYIAHLLARTLGVQDYGSTWLASLAAQTIPRDNKRSPPHLPGLGSSPLSRPGVGVTAFIILPLSRSVPPPASPRNQSVSPCRRAQSFAAPVNISRGLSTPAQFICD